jgi:hypothetical protein
MHQIKKNIKYDAHFKFHGYCPLTKRDEKKINAKNEKRLKYLTSSVIYGECDFLETELLNHLLGYAIYYTIPLRSSKLRYRRDEVEASLALLLLELEGDTTNWASSNALHQMGGESSNLVAHAL